MINIHHHLGLGDHIVCNGLVREIYNKHASLNLYCKKQNLESVSFMYRDLPNLEITTVDSDEDVVMEKNLLRVGFEHAYFYKNSLNITWDESFYKQCNIDFHKRWSSFFFLRDEDLEKKLFYKLNPDREPFSLIHSIGSDGFERVDKSLIRKDLKQIEIKKNHTGNIFDYSSLIESAQQVHCADSSFKHLIDSFSLKSQLFYHNTPARGAPHKSKNDWKTV